jgi:hypothetical protein
VGTQERGASCSPADSCFDSNRRFRISRADSEAAWDTFSTGYGPTRALARVSTPITATRCVKTSLRFAGFHRARHLRAARLPADGRRPFLSTNHQRCDRRRDVADWARSAGANAEPRGLIDCYRRNGRCARSRNSARVFLFVTSVAVRPAGPRFRQPDSSAGRAGQDHAGD